MKCRRFPIETRGRAVCFNHNMKPFIRSLLAAIWLASPALAETKPNFIFVVADDMGPQDTSHSGNPIAKTPHLDSMAADGLRFDNFYSAHATCSPGRMAILTGRTPLRARMVTTVGPMQEGEITVAMALKTAGYETAHFGKWGLGREGTHPTKAGFDTSIWNKGYYENDPNFYLNDSDKKGDVKPIECKGESSIVTVDKALEFIKPRVEREQPFFVQICFGSPHAPHKGHPDFLKLYADTPDINANYWAEVSGLDAAVGKLRKELRDMGIADNTLLWFVSDNGGISKASGIDKKGSIGVRTIGLLDWPGRMPKPLRTDTPVSHMDMYPTVMEAAGVKLGHQPPIDGASIIPLIEGKTEQRPGPIGFTRGGHDKKGGGGMETFKFSDGVWIDGRYKLRTEPARKKREAVLTLHDIIADPKEETNLADQHPEKVEAMLAALAKWREGVKDSYAGKDYVK